eukprot:TRINITY_DN783_c0_g1_i1.p1 TRINITY_DN783_c0_g1~~TRINITY_DN783_c0_g1_i1.p1  ORF type:complete len:1020 (+),score=346.29 TRINITY_DN783_c0_g1_i1:97-3156(+)
MSEARVQPSAGAVDDYLTARQQGKAVVVAKSGCTFCRKAVDELSAALASAPERLVVLYTDHVSDGGPLRQRAKEDSGGHPTVPIVFFGEEFVGGCSDVVQLKTEGKLYVKLGVCGPRGSGSQARGPPPAGGLFYFPHTLNGNIARAIAFQAVVCSVLGIIWREEAWAGWLMVGLGCDFVVRFTGGGSCSPLGAVAMVVTLPFKERMTAGAPKQFATFVGICFATTAGVLLVTDNPIPGSVVCAGLAGAAALEAFFDFCLGCWFFAMGIKFGVLPATVNDLHIGQRQLVINQVEHADDRQGELRPLEVYVHRQPGQPETPADLRVKSRKLDDHKRRGFHPVKHVQLGDCLMPVGVAGLAMAYRFGAQVLARRSSSGQNSYGRMSTPSFLCHEDIWKVLAYFSLGLFVILLTLLLVKAVMYPHKLWAEVKHPIKSNGSAAFAVALVLYGFLIPELDSDLLDEDGAVREKFTMFLGLVLFWIGAVLVKLQLLWKVSSLISRRGDAELVTPQLLFPIAGCLAAAVVAPRFEPYRTGYADFGFFLGSLALVLTLSLLGTSIVESVRYHWSDERIRPSIAMWPGILHLAMIAYVYLAHGRGGMQSSSSGSYLDVFSSILYFAGISLFLVLLWLAVPHGFLLRLKFDFSFWALAFPLDLLAIATILWHSGGQIIGKDFSMYVAYITLAVASYANATLFFNTLFWLLKGRWLRPAYKWAPLSLNKLTHEAFRAAGRRMLVAADALGGEGNSLAVAKELAQQWTEYSIVLEWHAHQEDRIMFREIDAFNPMATRDGYQQHRVLEQMEQQLSACARALLDLDANNWQGAGEQAAKELAENIRRYVPFMDRHMDWEEENLLAMNRRTFNMSIQIRIVQKIWDAYEGMTVEEFRGRPFDDVAAKSPCSDAKGDANVWTSYDMAAFREKGHPVFPQVASDKLFDFPPELPSGPLPLGKQQVWRLVLPYVVRNLPEPVMRTRFTRCWCWALPDRAQHIGEMIYRGVEDHEWSALVADVPEIVPRGLPGWSRRI